MDYKVYYGIPTFNQFARAEKAVEAVLAGSLVPNEIVIIDNSETGAGVEALKHLPERYRNVHLIPRTENILSGAWNDLMHMWKDDYVIIANDDVLPHKRSVEALVNAAINRPDVAMFNGSGHSGNSYSFFLLRQWAYAKVGPFDIKFKPAYFEDNDFDYRLMVLAGLLRIEVPEATFDHYGSATIRAMSPVEKDLRAILFRKAEKYYESKWGGKPSHERFTVPFAGIDLADL